MSLNDGIPDHLPFLDTPKANGGFDFGLDFFGGKVSFRLGVTSHTTSQNESGGFAHNCSLENNLALFHQFAGLCGKQTTQSVGGSRSLFRRGLVFCPLSIIFLKRRKFFGFHLNNSIIKLRLT